MKNLTDTGRVRFIAYGEEVCPNTGALHYQAYLVFYQPQQLSRCIRLFGQGHHFEGMRGTLKQNEDYCRKEGSFHKLGDEPKQGERNDIIGFKRRIDAGEEPADIARTELQFATYVKYHNGLEKYKRNLRLTQVMEDGFYEPELYVRIGPAGSGKTRWVFDRFGYANVCTMYPYQPGGKFFIPPDVGDVVLFDDVQAGSIPPLALFKQLTDGHPRKFECKGGEVVWRPKVIVITSNHPPSQWWPNISAADVQAIERRITEIVVVE